jgi:trypsin-like peptidase/putative peptidoglycan binding protein
MKHILAAVIVATLWGITQIAGAGSVLAQSATQGSGQGNTWIQIESQPSLRDAEARARIYAARLPDVAGFATNSNWYAIALGPYSADQAGQIRLNLIRRGLIPGDSFLGTGATFGRRIWPVGATATVPVAPAIPERAAPDPGTDAATHPQPGGDTPPSLADETPRQARASEALLSRAEKMDLQRALKWEGFYAAAIDGSFGRGTRASMRDLQLANGHVPSGVLTSAQRAALIASYVTALDRLGMEPVADAVAGIAIELPLGLVEFTRYQPPFVHYAGRNGSGVRVLLISQSGDSSSLNALHNILQTLEIVPEDGRRRLRRSGFSIEGRDETIVSYSEAALSNGQIKGFILVWPAGDERRRTQVVEAMKASFAPGGAAVLPDSYGDQAVQDIDLLSGLEIRRPDISRSGFYVDQGGAVLTTADVVAACQSVTIDTLPAQVVAVAGGLALLRPEQVLAPQAVARFQPCIARLKSEIAVAGYSFGGRLLAPSLTWGSLAELQGLRGEQDVMRLALAALPGDAGGPVYDRSGAVLGMLLPKAVGARALPDGTAFASDMETVTSFLSDQGIAASAAARGAEADGLRAPQELTAMAAQITVLVSCWN